MAEGNARSGRRAALELFALSGFAVAQPLLDYFGRNASELVVGAYSSFQIVLMVLAVLVVPPFVAWLAENIASRFGSTMRRTVHAGWAGAAGLVVTITLVKPRTGLSPVPILGLGVAVGGVLGVLVFRFSLVRQWLRFLAVAPLLFAGLFVFASPATTVIDGRDPAVAVVSVRQPHRVVMVVMDEFPLESLLDGSGHIDTTLFPNFGALAAQSTWYRNSTTVSPFTETAVPALLTGREPPSASALPSADTYPHNLFTLLGGTYRMNVHEPLTRLCPTSLCSATRAGGSVADLGRTAASDWWRLATPGRTPVEKLQTATWPQPQFAGEPFVRSLRPSARPELDFLHVALPHQEWRFLPSGQDNHGGLAPGVHTPPNEFAKPRWTNPWSALSGRQAHLLQVQATDLLIGRIVARLRKVHAYDDTLLVVTADHGAAFDPNEPLRGVSATNYPQVLWTPMFIKQPGQASSFIDDRPVRSVDVVPTIADALGVKIPWPVDGRSVTSAPRTSTTVRTLDWDWSTIHPEHGRFLAVDGRRGFASVLKAQATNASGEPGLRVYRVGPYGALIGTSVAGTVGTPASGRVMVPKELTAPIDPTAHDVRWARPAGLLQGVAPNTWLAITVDDTVVGLTRAYVRDDGITIYWAELAPSLVGRGTHRIGAWEVTGPATSPRLARLTVVQ